MWKDENIMKEEERILKEDEKLYNAAKDVTSKDSITQEDIMLINNIVDQLIANDDYTYLTFIKQLPFDNEVIREKIERKIKQMELSFEVFLDYVNFSNRGRIDELKKYYQDHGMFNYLQELNEMIDVDSRAR